MMAKGQEKGKRRNKRAQTPALVSAPACPFSCVIVLFDVFQLKRLATAASFIIRGGN